MIRLSAPLTATQGHAAVIIVIQSSAIRIGCCGLHTCNDKNWASSRYLLFNGCSLVSWLMTLCGRARMVTMDGSPAAMLTLVFLPSINLRGNPRRSEVDRSNVLALDVSRYSHSKYFSVTDLWSHLKFVFVEGLSLQAYWQNFRASSVEYSKLPVHDSTAPTSFWTGWYLSKTSYCVKGNQVVRCSALSTRHPRGHTRPYKGLTK